MNVPADIGVGSHYGYCGVGHVFGVGRCEADTHFRGGFGHERQQCCKICCVSGRFVGVEVAVDVLSEQRHFLEAFCAQVGEFAQD